VSRVTADGPPGLYAFEVDRAGRGPLLVVWDHRDPFDGEDEPPADLSWPWPADTATVTDVFGHAWTTQPHDGQIRLPVGADPLFVELAPGPHVPPVPSLGTGASNVTTTM
jgi:hypothetical protein